MVFLTLAKDFFRIRKFKEVGSRQTATSMPSSLVLLLEALRIFGQDFQITVSKCSNQKDIARIDL